MGDLLIITNSYDVTTDLLLDRLPDGRVFRLNFDQFGQYQVRFNSNGFCVTSPGGRSISSSQVSKAYWRKPFSAEPETGEFQKAADYVHAEWRYALNEIVNLLWAEDRFVLVEPYAERRTGKLIQLLHANRYFVVPPFEFISNHRSSVTESVAKSLSSELVGGKVLYTTRVKTEELDYTYPWFLQEYVSALYDVTVAYVRGEMFAFRLMRDFLDASPDWRRQISPRQQWEPVTLPSEIHAAISEYMAYLKLNFGRLDFLLDDEQRYWFCEVNPNGQFAWLDLNDAHGLLRAVVEEISPLTEHHPIVVRHPLDSPPAFDGEELCSRSRFRP